MRKRLSFSALLLAVSLMTLQTAFAQAVTITGTVRSTTANMDAVPSVSVSVKGGTSGVYTDPNGNFRIFVPRLPVTLIFTSIGFETQEVTVTNADAPVSVDFLATSTLGQEVVVAATRTPQRILESPVSIERVGLNSIRNASVPNYYDMVKSLKGVDLITSSLTFKTVGTRGFNGSGNLRFNQLTDGMDNQAPGLNFSVGSIVGPTELDVDNFELLQGASSALYGSGGTNGTMLITSKNPFRYQGLSFQIKQGVNHINSSRGQAAPYYDWSVRWAKTLGQRWAFKISGQLINARDWEADDRRNLNRTNVFSSIKPGNRRTDPNYDGVNVFGDEASAAMAYVAQGGIFGPSNPTLASVGQALAQQLGRAPTPNEIVGFYAGNSAYGSLFLLANGLARGYYGGQLVSRTGYDERDLVDYNAYNFKVNGGLHYKITNDIEASLTSYVGTGTTVYTGADRYVLKNLLMGQYKAEVRAPNWFLRGYTTQENSGDSYTATTAALYINNEWRANGTWFGTYSAIYSQNRLGGASDYNAHIAARNAADAGRLIPGTQGFQQVFDKAVNTTINNGGAKFADASDLYHFEGQYQFTQVKEVDITLGANYRTFHLNSKGTIFADTAAPININEAGAYLQLQKSFLNDVLRLTGSIRYDKQKNFDGRFTPRATALFKVAENNNIRVSYQTAYRFPSNQDQYINLLTGGANRLIGGLPDFERHFGFTSNPAYTSESIVAYRNSISLGAPNPTLLKTAQFRYIKPERVNSYELGYRGLATSKLLIDAYVYYSIYKDFIGRVAVGRGKSGVPANAPTDLASPFTTDNISFVVNTENEVKALGWAFSANYNLPRGFELFANISGDQLRDVPANVVTFFNTPKWKYNLGLSNNNLYRNFGFGLQWRWQDRVMWEGTFGTGDVPAYGTLDGQISFKMPKTKTVFKLGGSNILNEYYQSAFGNPQVGGIYYISFGYNL